MENPLVSIGVITYNSATTIVETLDSAYQQTYENLELIISDDCSSDDTVVICKKWLESYGHRFVNTKIVTVPVNTGTSANCNRAIVEAQGEWFKGIAGDDIFFPNCIEECIKYVKNNPDIHIFTSSIQSFTTDKEGKFVLGNIIPNRNEIVDFNSKTAQEQFIMFLQGKGVFPAPGVFLRRKLILDNPYNEMYKFSEDSPKWIDLTKKGYYLSCLDKVLVLYRRGLTITSSNQYLFSRSYLDSIRLYFWNELGQLMLKNGCYDRYKFFRLNLLCIDLIDCFTDNRYTFKNRIIRKLIETFFLKFMIKFFRKLP